MSLAEASAKGADAYRAGALAFAANALSIITSIRASGFENAPPIAAELNARRVDTVRSGKWTAVQVTRLIKRAAEGPN